MKTIRTSCLALVLLTSVSSCSKKDDAGSHYSQKEDVNSSPSSYTRSADANALMTVYDVNSSPSWRIRSFEIADMSPLEFLLHLQTTERETVQIGPVPDGWVKEADLPMLFALLDSQDKCAAVVAPDWSPHVDMCKPSTVGREAGFLIKSFAEQWYPASLGLPISNRYPYPAPLGRTITDADKEDLRKWWAQHQGRKRQNLT